MKRIVVVFFVLVLLAACFVGCSKKDEPERIGIISAMDNEIDILLDEAHIDRVDTIGGVKYHVGTLRGKNVVITRAGIGKVLATAGATTLVNSYNISKIVFTGIAGGVADELDVLDEVVATKLVEHDYGLLTDNGLEWMSGDPGMGGEPGVYYECDPALVEIAYNAAVEVVGAEHAHKGVIATGDQFISSEAYVQTLHDDFNAYACEMEGAAIAIVCTKYGKPFVVIRALSDKADGKAHESYVDFGDVAGDNSSSILLKMLEKM